MLKNESLGLSCSWGQARTLSLDITLEIEFGVWDFSPINNFLNEGLEPENVQVKVRLEHYHITLFLEQEKIH